MNNNISFGKITITNYPEYFEIKDNKKRSKILYLTASFIFILVYLADLYENNFDFGKLPYFRHFTGVIWLIIFILQYRINVENKIEKSKIKEIVVKKNHWTSIVIHYENKKRKIDGFSQDESEQIVRFLMNNR